ncbi:MAG TPA: DUF4954 family protein [Phycisphaerales bacterium]|nr:DUF4954 family protein [Phycisphaerales bacterium]
MDTVSILSPTSIGRHFVPPEYLPADQDEYALRNAQSRRPPEQWRHLHSYEVELLVKNSNSADNWDEVLVTDDFDPRRIRNTEFFGLVRIGRLRAAVLEHHDLQVATGITNSKIIACDVGDDVAIHHVRYLAHYIIGDRCVLANIDEMHTTNHSKFGNGILKDGEPEEVRVWLDLVNETGSRRVLPFDEMITADAYLWAKYRDDAALQARLKEITQDSYDSRRGYYGTVGDQCVIKNCRIIKDVKIGSHCYIKGANKLKNLTIKSSQAEPTQIGEGVELVNGIVGLHSRVFYGCKAVRFIMGNNCSLKYGARLLNSFLGDNSTVSCCEILNNLIFPAHEQHHNNSFLVASCVLGQSNIAAGATIGSNHNSRANDNEILAGRGFWPGLCSTIKHSCRFASFVLLVKGDYPAELDIPLPFALLNNNVAQNRLEVLPAFWWLYNMYALARNTWKFQVRDHRKTKVQNVEFDSLAPDTIEEIFTARRLLEVWVGKAALSHEGADLTDKDDDEVAEVGRRLLTDSPQAVAPLEILGEHLEKSKRKVVILRAAEAYAAYGQMLHYYAVKNLLDYLEAHPEATLASMHQHLAGPRERHWVNLGGQLVRGDDVDQLRSDIGSGVLTSWAEIHHRYDALWQDYPQAKQRHAWATLCTLLGTETIDPVRWEQALQKAADIQELIRDEVFASRKKDFDNPFRQATYRSETEMRAAIGTIEEDGFVKQVRQETEDFKKRIDLARPRTQQVE